MNSLQSVSSQLGIKLSEIRLSMRHPENRNKVFVLLEGETDIKLFRNIFSHQYVDTTALHGKEKLLIALETLQTEGYSQLIAIKDADFDHLEDVNYPDNLFATDYHDMEVEMIESDALNSIINEYADEECYSLLIENLRDGIYSIAKEIGYIRWHSDRVGGLFNFKRIAWSTLISYNDCQISFNRERLIELLLEQIEDAIDIEDGISQLKESASDKRQLSNGHDLTLLLSNYFSSNINQSKIEQALRLSYTMEQFQTTSLYDNLKDWASSNSYRLFA